MMPSPSPAPFALAQACVEPSGRRLDRGWEFYQGSLGSLWEVWRGAAATDNVPWTPVELPHCFNARDAVDPDLRYYQGPGWYRLRLKLDDAFPMGRVLLHFNGTGQRARVYVGLELVGEHVGGYDEWTVDLTAAARVAVTRPENLEGIPLAVWCDNSRDAETIPSDLSDFNRYGGLYRHVTLVQVPAVALARVHIVTRITPSGAAAVQVRARLHNPEEHAGSLSWRVELRNPDGVLIHHSAGADPIWDGWRTLVETELADPELWSPANPARYRCDVRIDSPHGAHACAERFGLRAVEWVPHGPFKLNGERLLLRGTHYHEDHAGCAAALPDDVVRATMRAMKDMGANFVRLGHYQQAPLVLELCDELGLLVWEEIPWCRGGLGGEGFKTQCRAMLRAMIEQHHNHPAVILWGLGNENDWPGDFPTFDQEAIRVFMRELHELSHALDSERKTAIRRCAFCRDIVDVYSPSIWAGWYGGRYIEYREATEQAIADTPHFFHAEYGGDSHAGRFSEEPERFLADVALGQGTAEVGSAYKASGGRGRGSRDSDWSESYMANLFDWHLKEQEQMPTLTGAAQWVFKDFSTPLRPENPVPRVNQKGLLERDGTPKESYFIFQSYWATRPMIRLFGHRWAVRWGRPDEAKEVKVFSNCPEAELFVNGFSAGRRRRNSADFPAAGLRWSVRLREGANTLRAVGWRDGVEVADEIRCDYQSTPWGLPARLEFAVVERRGDTFHLETRALDGAGVPCLDAALPVRFGVTGDGRLLDHLGTADGSRLVQLANGRARIGLTLTGTIAIVSVECRSMRTQTILVNREN